MKKTCRPGWPALISLLASMKTAINLLIIIGVISTFGTLIPQGQTPEFYLSHYGVWIGKAILFLSLNSLYQSWWYQILLALLCLSLFACCYRRLRSITSIKKTASFCFHLAIVIVLIGAAWSLGSARSVLVEINEGEKIDLADYGFAPGELSLQQFNIDYYPDYQPRQYRSQLHLKDYRGQDYTEEISVNQPLRAGNLKIYQNSWGWTLKLSDQGAGTSESLVVKNYDAYPLNAKGLYLKAIFIPDYDPVTVLESKTPLPNNPHLLLVLVQNEQMIDMAIISVGSQAELGQYHLRFEGYSYYSGLEIKSDSGVYLVFTGFILLLFSLFARYWRLFLPRKVD
ncbi:MAG: cytochrome c biogenesis protein ResB [Syntrophomonadales bacterium]|jgi:cytochrome c biogenesis protein